MFDRYQAGEQAILVHLDFPDENAREDLQEFEMLVSSAGINALTIISGKRNTPHIKFFVGSGKEATRWRCGTNQVIDLDEATTVMTVVGGRVVIDNRR